MTANLDALVAFFEALTPADVERFDTFYAEDAHFVDPFNDVQGVPAIAAIFRHMFEQLGDPRFVVTERFVQDDRAVLIWSLRCRLGGRWVEIPGASHLCFGADGRVRVHRDFWDAASGVYARLPLIGGLMRCARHRLSAPQPGRR
ncbi:nuclear transport factor 2 family protein [Denitromonas iodatirespirans]|uniref:Nuclear transport factor 2 family protein n=1 Tax=Denitromonas iodatirespirans TaxID=2795389 RepID=A0A944HDZ7_DENI1|nr:nuclear transport factor 2 family protein [Denitromonas iodatirespirans]MBT0962456.1 nuclear transport factor 2 family protein [Denitromonas iodatirespirans]